MSAKYLRRPAVSERYNLPRSTLYDLIAKGHFPRPVRLGVRAVLSVDGARPEVLAAHGTLLASENGHARLRVEREGALPELAAALVHSGALLYSMTPHKRSLEATFLEVMGEDQRPG